MKACRCFEEGGGVNIGTIRGVYVGGLSRD